MLSRAHALTRDLPRDQALGLRLLALASAAAGLHMAQAAATVGGAEFEGFAQEEAEETQIVRSQAATLMEMFQTAKAHGPEGRRHEHGGRAA